MRRTVVTVFFTFIAAAFVFVAGESIFAQDADTLDVAQGYETLNLAVEGDTTVAGDPKNLNRVYRLERGGYYLLNGTIKGIKGAPLRIVAAKGDGPKPILVPAVGETGAASAPFNPKGDATWKGLYITDIDNLGILADGNMLRCDKKDGRYIIDDCFLDYSMRALVRVNALNQKFYITNTIARNAHLSSAPANGRFFDVRAGNQPDTIFVQNSTVYVTTGYPVCDWEGVIKNFIMDHVTMYQVGGFSQDQIQIRRCVNAQVTNSLFIDFGYEGDIRSKNPVLAAADSLLRDFIPIDSLKAPDLVAEEQRVYTIKNNVYGWTPQVRAWYDGIDTVQALVWHNKRSQRMIDKYPNIVSENNIEEYPVFSDPPTPEVIVAYAQHRLETNRSEVGNPDPCADRNGRAVLVDDPTSVGPAPDEYDFDYSTSSQAYTHAEGGLPVGDLNWWGLTSVEHGNPLKGPGRFDLAQNFPNPFNPSTTIVYQLSAPVVVKLSVYNTLGQKIRTLVSEKRQAAGDYSVQWNGLDDSSRMVASGFYMYRLEADNQVQTKKMLLIR